jgi:P27 family predicted phage terminase small subunit
MGARGPLPKEEGRRQRARGQKNNALIAAYEPTDIPEAPDNLSIAQLEAWEEFFTSDLAGIVQKTDLPVVRRLWTYYQQHEDLTVIFEKSKLVAGSTGQPRINPAHDAILKLETAIHRLENELGLTPSARLRLGITFADATNSIDALNERFSETAILSDDDLWKEA